MSTWIRVVPCHDVEARPVWLGGWRCPQCRAIYPDVHVPWVKLHPVTGRPISTSKRWTPPLKDWLNPPTIVSPAPKKEVR
jgi:hypothetical protein